MRIRLVLAALAALYASGVQARMPDFAWALNPGETTLLPAQMLWYNNWCTTSWGTPRPYGCDRRPFGFMVVARAPAEARAEVPQGKNMFSPECARIGIGPGGLPEDTIGMFDWFGPKGPKAHCAFAYETLRDEPPITRLPKTAFNCLVPAVVSSLVNKETPRQTAMSILQDSHTLATDGVKGFVPTPLGFGMCVAIGTVITEAVVYHTIDVEFQKWKKSQK